MSTIIIKLKHGRDGYRRAGLAFTKAGVEINRGDLSKDQLAAIEADPRLTVVEVEPVKATAAKSSTDEAGKASKQGTKK